MKISEIVKRENLGNLPIYKAQLLYMYEYKEMTAKEISNILEIKTTDIYNYINHNTLPRERIIIKLENMFFARLEKKIKEMQKGY